MKFCMLQHFIRVFTVCQNTSLLVLSIQRVNSFHSLLVVTFCHMLITFANGSILIWIQTIRHPVRFLRLFCFQKSILKKTADSNKSMNYNPVLKEGWFSYPSKKNGPAFFFSFFFLHFNQKFQFDLYGLHLKRESRKEDI